MTECVLYIAECVLYVIESVFSVPVRVFLEGFLSLGVCFVCQ